MGWDPKRPWPKWFHYVLLAYGISWVAWGIWAVLPNTSDAVGTALFVVGVSGPFIAGASTIHAEDGPVTSWLAEIFTFRVTPQYYALALGLPIVVLLVATVVHQLVFDVALVTESVPPLSEYPLYLGFVLLLGGGFEEPGWRGYLLPRLQRQYSALTSAVVVGIVWTGWHAPLFLVPSTPQSSLSPWLYAVQILALSIVLTAITNAAGGSVVPAMLLHAGGNAIVNFYPIGGASGATTPPGFAILVGVLSAVAIGFVWVYGPNQLAPGD